MPRTLYQRAVTFFARIALRLFLLRRIEVVGGDLLIEPPQDFSYWVEVRDGRKIVFNWLQDRTALNSVNILLCTLNRHTYMIVCIFLRRLLTGSIRWHVQI